MDDTIKIFEAATGLIIREGPRKEMRIEIERLRQDGRVYGIAITTKPVGSKVGFPYN